jgi:hypothetical protein
VCGIYIFDEKKEKAKQIGFRTRRFLRDAVQHGQNLLPELTMEDDSGFRNFVGMTKSDSATETWPHNPEERYKVSGSNSCIRLAATLRYFSSGAILRSIEW